jgi:formylglycine-generating enzyme required for sulfatase activity
MLRKKPSAPTPDEEDIVRLKPILGIRPGVYLAIACALVLLLVLFLVLIYPGITRPGSMVVFSSDPSGAALRVDDVYLGTSPCKVFVSRGDHVMEMVLPGFETKRVECTVPGRLFASLLFPKRYDLNVQLHTTDPMAALAVSASDYAAWSFGGEPTAVWQIPLSLSEGVYRVGNTEGIDGMIAAAARFAVTRAALRDLVRAQFLASSGGISPSPLGVVHSVSTILAFLADNPGSAAWLADTLPADSTAILISSAWYQSQLAAFADITAGEELASRPGEGSAPPPLSQVRVSGLMFTGIGGGRLVQGEPFPHQVPVEAFMICVTGIPIPAYADFLDANPRWHPDQRDTLEEQGLVSGEYLADFENDAPLGIGHINTGISSVSWFAAKAYCDWLTTKLPASLTGWEVRLPTEAEWEYAAKSTQRWGSGGIILGGSAWEWCANPYSPLPFLAAPPEAVNLIESPEYPVRGGSWLNAPGSISPETRASLPPETCSPFVSFRPVIARRGQ